jgi:hypothetical protein
MLSHWVEHHHLSIYICTEKKPEKTQTKMLKLWIELKALFCYIIHK